MPTSKLIRVRLKLGGNAGRVVEMKYEDAMAIVEIGHAMLVDDETEPVAHAATARIPEDSADRLIRLGIYLPSELPVQPGVGVAPQGFVGTGRRHKRRMGYS